MSKRNALQLFYLGTCSTCARIMKDLNVKQFPFVWNEIKTQPITGEQLDRMKKMAGSYEALFSRIALKYRALGLHTRALTEADFRILILEEYTFLKRPVFIIGDAIFIGNSKKNIAAVAAALQLFK